MLVIFASRAATRPLGKSLKSAATLEIEVVAPVGDEPRLYGATSSEPALSDAVATRATVNGLRASAEPLTQGASSVMQEPTPATPTSPSDEPDRVPSASCDVPAFDLSQLNPANVARVASTMSLGDERDAGTIMQEEFAEIANSRRHLSTRPPPDLHARRDGSYSFSNSRFHATILPNGDVEFRDRRLEVGRPEIGWEEDPEYGDRIVINLITLRFDITEEWMRAHDEDPLRTERAWFMRETEELRNRLHVQADRIYNHASLGALAERLARIADDPTLSLERKHRAVFETWDDCETSAIGEIARTRIEGFVRERFPEGTALAFTEAELLACNARRATAVPFAPYAASARRDAGAG